MLVSALEEEVAAYLERHADAEAGCWWSGRDRAGAGHHLWFGHPGSSAPRVNDRRVNEQEARVPVWEEEYRQFFCQRSLEDYNVYVWRAWSALQRTARMSGCARSLFIGARADGQKELIAVEDGDREKAESLKTVLRDLKRRGMQAPLLAVGDAAPSRRRCGRCVACDARTTRWVPQDAQVLDKLPSVQGHAKP